MALKFNKIFKQNYVNSSYGTDRNFETQTESTCTTGPVQYHMKEIFILRYTKERHGAMCVICPCNSFWKLDLVN
jgi:hypothetical protein